MAAVVELCAFVCLCCPIRGCSGGVGGDSSPRAKASRSAF